MLSDPAKRKEYDEARALFGAGPMGGGGFGAPGRPGTTTFDLGDLFGRMGQGGGGAGGGLGDVFGGIFNGGVAGPARRPRRGADVESEVSLDVRPVAGRGDRAAAPGQRGPCPRCAGTGARAVPCRGSARLRGRRSDDHERQWVRDLRTVPGVPRPWPRRRRPVPRLQGIGPGAVHPYGQGRASRPGSRTASGSGCAARARPGERRGEPATCIVAGQGRGAPGVRARRRQPHRHGARDLRRGFAGSQIRVRADRWHRDATTPGGYRERAHDAGTRQGAAPQGRHPGRPAGDRRGGGAHDTDCGAAEGAARRTATATVGR